MNREGKRGRTGKQEKGRKHRCRREGKMNRVARRKRRTWAGRKRSRGRWLGPSFRCSPGLSWGDIWALDGMAQDVAFDATLGLFPVWIGHRRRKEKTEGDSASPGSISSSSQRFGRLEPSFFSSHPSRMFSPHQIYKN